MPIPMRPMNDDCPPLQALWFGLILSVLRSVFRFTSCAALTTHALGLVSHCTSSAHRLQYGPTNPPVFDPLPLCFNTEASSSAATILIAAPPIHPPHRGFFRGLSISMSRS
ncbi:hypothetical protein C8Q70DRAFT_1038025 [Cubamyces menziesii]|nr:hypothetical protein C8Q70DRAFT_1038025 [Cubamyces menziesii]